LPVNHHNSPVPIFFYFFVPIFFLFFKNKESGGKRLAVSQHPEQGEKIGPSLNLINDDDPLERAKGEVRFIQASETGGLLQVETP
jgi:hypothetical protein